MAKFAYLVSFLLTLFRKVVLIDFDHADPDFHNNHDEQDAIFLVVFGVVSFPSCLLHDVLSRQWI